MSRTCAVHKFEWLNSETAWIRMKPQYRQRHRIEAVPPLPAASFFGREDICTSWIAARPTHNLPPSPTTLCITLCVPATGVPIRGVVGGSRVRCTSTSPFALPWIKTACCCWWIAQHSRHAQLVRHRGIVARIAKAIRGLHCAD